MPTSDNRTLINFVCTANICRSPVAEYLFQKELEKRAAADLRWGKFQAISTGVAAANGERISRHSLEVLAAQGIDASGHRSQFLTQAILDKSFATFCMTSTHKLIIEMRYDAKGARVHLMREFMPGKVSREVPDPYGSALEDYAICRDEIATAIPSVFAYLETQF